MAFCVYFRIFALRAKLSGAVYCNRSYLWDCLFVCVFVCVCGSVDMMRAKTFPTTDRSDIPRWLSQFVRSPFFL